jgi:hypothetical protein
MGDLKPRWGAGTPEELIAAERIFQGEGISYRQLADLRASIQKVGINGLSAEESALFQQVVRVHAEIAGATPRSPLLSLTRLSPEEALQVFNRPAASGGPGIGTVTQRSYIVRVRVDPNSVADVNSVLQRAAPGSRLASELEVVVAEELSTTSNTARILSVTRNPSPVAPLGGAAGGALVWVGRGLIVLGAAITIAQVVTAKGPHQHEQEGSALGSFTGGMMLGAFGAGFCVGAGIATGGIALFLCAGAWGVAGGLGGGWVGGKVGSLFD